MTGPQTSQGLYGKFQRAPGLTEGSGGAHRPAQPQNGEAAVLVLFRLAPAGTEVLLIRRADRQGDPWSGQTAFPGGRREAEDLDLRRTVERETEEEVGLAPTLLEGPPLHVGTRAPANRPWLHVGVFLDVLRDGVDGTVRLSPEVAEVLWAPVGELRPSPEPLEVTGSGGRFRADALLFRHLMIWGFTRRVLLDVLEAYGPLLPR